MHVSHFLFDMQQLLQLYQLFFPPVSKTLLWVFEGLKLQESTRIPWPPLFKQRESSVSYNLRRGLRNGSKDCISICVARWPCNTTIRRWFKTKKTKKQKWRPPSEPSHEQQNLPLSLDSNQTWARGDGCMETDRKQLCFWHSNCFYEWKKKKDYPHTALGKCFNKPPIMPCRVIWTRSKIHTISCFSYIFK